MSLSSLDPVFFKGFCCLSGEPLDYSSCESLEEILKHVQFDSINLQETDLEENVSLYVFWLGFKKN